MKILRLRGWQKIICLGIILASTFSCSPRPKEETYSNPVLGGDFPDPSVIRVGADYWATTTSSEWAPVFPLLRSRDLVNWKMEGTVFPKRPEWSVGNYSAPRISEFHGRYLVYYAARKKDGPLAIAVASASRPGGPYTDHGPMISQEMGSSDPFMTVDEQGDAYLIWKEDGSSHKKPAIIWAQKLSNDGTRITGEAKELMRNDAPWEGSVVDGPFVLRHREWFFMFFSGNGCCGASCNCALGVARAKNLLGPWEKKSRQPDSRGQ